MAQYLKPDSELGYVEDNAQIECLKFNNLRHSILGCMLGDFNEVGDYVVSPEIVRELIAMEKYIVQTYDNIELCKGFLKLDKQISFMVSFEGNKATLSLVEKMNYEANFSINSGTYSNINEYVLDTIETSGEVDRNTVYARWNISPFSGNIVDIFNCDESILEKYFGIVKRFKYLLEANKILLEKEEQIDEIESSYANEIFDVLKHFPKFEKVVVETIKQTLTEKKQSVSLKKPFFAKTFNEVLENAIVYNQNILDEKERQEFEVEKRNAVINLNIKRGSLLEIEHLKDDESKNEMSAILTLKVPTTTHSKKVSELGEAFVSTHKATLERISTKRESAIDKTASERDKLISTLVGAGVGALVGGATGAVVGAVAGATVGEIVEKTNTEKKGEPTPKKAVAKKVVKKPAAKKAEKKPAAKKAEKKPAEKEKKPETKKAEQKKNDKKPQLKDAKEEGLIARVLSGRTLVNKNPLNAHPKVEMHEDIKAEMLTEEEMLKIEEEILNKSHKTETGKILTDVKTEEKSIVRKETKSSHKEIESGETITEGILF